MSLAARTHAVSSALLVAGAVFVAGGAAGQSASAPTATWPVAGRQGIIQVVIVPETEASDREAYVRQVAALCVPQMSCFINFFTNSTGAPVSVPLPDAIEQEATALFRRSTKQGAEMFRWSCRMKRADENCF